MLWLVYILVFLLVGGIGYGVYYFLRPTPTTNSTLRTSPSPDGTSIKPVPPRVDPKKPDLPANAVYYPVEPMTSEESLGYKVSASSNFSCGMKLVCAKIFFACDADPKTFWNSALTYNPTTGLYSGNVKTIVEGQEIVGEWIQLDLPLKVTPLYVEIQPPEPIDNYPRGMEWIATQYETCSPRNFIILGSNDGMLWNTLFTNLTTEGIKDWSTIAKYIRIYISASSLYQKFRLVATRVGNEDANTVANQNALAIGGFKVIGIPEGGSPPPETPPPPPIERVILTDVNKTPKNETLATWSRVSLGYNSSTRQDEYRTWQENCTKTSGNFNYPLEDEVVQNNSYNYGLVSRLNPRTDGVFVKQNCQGRFVVEPNQQPTYCASRNESVEYCVPKGEVFHVTRPTQFTFDEAKQVCAQYESELASRNQMINATAHGAHWCSPGWIENSSTAKPSQLESCSGGQIVYRGVEEGRPGILYDTGTPEKAGVNCYGKRPTVPANEHTILPHNPLMRSMYDDVQWASVPYQWTSWDERVEAGLCLDRGGIYPGYYRLFPGCNYYYSPDSWSCCVPNKANWILGKEPKNIEWSGVNSDDGYNSEVTNCSLQGGIYTNGKNDNFPGCGTSKCCIADPSKNKS